MKKAKKEFDAVLMMREIRDRLSGQIEGMSFEEEKRFIRKHVPQPKARRSNKHLTLMRTPPVKRQKSPQR